MISYIDGKLNYDKKFVEIAWVTGGLSLKDDTDKTLEISVNVLMKDGTRFDECIELDEIGKNALQISIDKINKKLNNKISANKII